MLTVRIQAAVNIYLTYMYIMIVRRSFLFPGSSTAQESSITAHDVSNLVSFLSEIASEVDMKEHLGRSMCSGFWNVLLSLLSTTPLQVAAFAPTQTDQVCK